jgi:hypothetical protein
MLLYGVRKPKHRFRKTLCISARNFNSFTPQKNILKMKKKSYTIYSASFAICIIGMFSAVSVNAQTITTYAGTGTSGYTGDGAAATSAKLSGPGSSCADAAGNLYIAD